MWATFWNLGEEFLPPKGARKEPSGGRFAGSPATPATSSKKSATFADGSTPPLEKKISTLQLRAPSRGPPLIQAQPLTTTLGGEAAAAAIQHAALRSPPTAPSSAARQAMVASQRAAEASRDVDAAGITVAVDRSSAVCGRAQRCWAPFSATLSLGTSDDPPLCGYQLDPQRAPPFGSLTTCDLDSATDRSSCPSTSRAAGEAGTRGPSFLGGGDQAAGAPLAWGGGVDGLGPPPPRPAVVPPLRLEKLAQSKAVGGIQQKQLLQNLQDLRNEAAVFDTTYAHQSVFA